MHCALNKLYYLFYLMLFLASIYGGRIPIFFILSVWFQLLLFEWSFWWQVGECFSFGGNLWYYRMIFFIDSISFFRTSISFCNVAFLLSSVCFTAGTSAGVLLLVLRLRRAFNIEFLTEYLVRFVQDFVCWIYTEDLVSLFYLATLRMTVCNVRFSFYHCEWFLRFFL